MARLLVALGTAGMIAIASAMPAAAAPLTATPAASAESMVTTVAMKKKVVKKKLVKKVHKKKVVKVAVAPGPVLHPGRDFPPQVSSRPPCGQRKSTATKPHRTTKTAPGPAPGAVLYLAPPGAHGSI